MLILSLVSNLLLTNEARVSAIWTCQSNPIWERRDKDRTCQNEAKRVQTSVHLPCWDLLALHNIASQACFFFLFNVFTSPFWVFYPSSYGRFCLNIVNKSNFESFYIQTNDHVDYDNCSKPRQSDSFQSSEALNSILHKHKFKTKMKRNKFSRLFCPPTKLLTIAAVSLVAITMFYFVTGDTFNIF